MERVYTSREKFAEDWGTDVPGPDVERVVFYGKDLTTGVLEYIFTDCPIRVDTTVQKSIDELERMFRL